MRNYDFSKFVGGASSARAVRVYRRTKRWCVAAYDLTGYEHVVYRTGNQSDALSAMVEVRKIINTAFIMCREHT